MDNYVIHYRKWRYMNVDRRRVYDYNSMPDRYGNTLINGNYVTLIIL